MTTITIELTDDEAARLEEQARRTGQSTADVAAERIREALAREAELREAIDYVLTKNAELHRRLA